MQAPFQFFLKLSKKSGRTEEKHWGGSNYRGGQSKFAVVI